jgi:N-acyl-L-homoserine lactone synthetase
MSGSLTLMCDGFLLEQTHGGEREARLMRFRHRVFREELRWLAEAPDGLDRDGYDQFSDNYAVSTGVEVVGSVRMTPGNYPFMIEREFRCLLPAGWRLEKNTRSAEITRFAAGLDANGQRPEVIGRLLYFCMYEWARMHQVQRMYFVVEPRYFRLLLRLGFPAFALGPPQALEGGVLSQAGFMDWSRAEPRFIHWVQSVAVCRAVDPARSHASGCLHSAYG